MKPAFVLLLLTFLPLVCQAQSAAEAPKTFDLKAIDAYVAAQQKEKGFVGLSLAIMQDGKIVFAKGYGQRSIEPSLPVDENTSFCIGSITKQFTCACLFLLAEEGKLSVNDPVAKYYPDLTRAKDITLLDLMNHTSGYPDYYPLDFLDRRMLKPIPFEKMLTDYAKVKLDFEPGSKFSYSNTGYMILGGIIEKVSGESLGKFMERRILKPLKMEHSQYASTKGLPSVAQGYTSFAIGAPEKSIYEADGWIEAAGGLWASASDLLRWDLALVTGKVLKPESYKLMTSIRPLSTGKISDYGCGLGIGFTKGDMVLQHTGGVSGFVSYNAMLPGKKSAVVLLSNAEHVSPGPVRNLIFNLLVKEVQKNDDPAVPKIAGPAPKEAVLAFLKEMQSGKLDREKLGEEFSFYLNPERVQGASERLKKLGDPESVDVGGTTERGGMEVANVKLKFKTATLRASMYRTPDGKIQQLLFYNE